MATTYRIPTQNGTYEFTAPEGLSQEGLSTRFAEAYAKGDVKLIQESNYVNRPIKATLETATKATSRAIGGLVEPLASAGASLVSGQHVAPDYSSANLESLGGPLARLAIPQDEMQLLALAGTAGAGGLAAKAGLTGLRAAGTRITGGALGGELGGAISGAPTGVGATIGGAGAALGEGVAFGVGQLQKFQTNRILERIHTQDAARVGTALETAGPKTATGDPVFRGYRTPEELRQLTKGGRGYEILGKLQDDADAAIGQVLGPKLVSSPKDAAVYLPYPAARLELKELYAAAYLPKQANPETATIKGLSPKRAYEEASARLSRDLGIADPTGQATSLFQAAQQQFRLGKTLLDTIAPAFKAKQTDFLDFNTSAIQNLIGDKERLLRAKIGDRALTALAAAVRLETIGVADTAGSGGTLFRFFQNLPGPFGLSEPVRSGVPTFVGRPQAPSAGTRILTNVFGQKAASEAAGAVNLSPMIQSLQEGASP